MKKTGIALFCSWVLFLAIQCHKAGTGGKASVSVHVNHHEQSIPGATLYAKYNAKEFPGTDLSKYDLVQVCGTTGHAAGHTHVKDLKYGYYYFYAEGFDSTINEKVSGGVPLRIKYSESKKQIDLDVPVTE